MKYNDKYTKPAYDIILKYKNLSDTSVTAVLNKGEACILEEICPRSDPDIAHMRYYKGTLNLTYKLFIQQPLIHHWVWNLG